MELLSLYQLFFTFSMMFGGIGSITAKTVILSSVLALLIWSALFVLQGVGVSTMAKNRGIGKRYLAFLPFVNLLYLGRLAGDCDFFGHKMKRPGLYAMIAQIAATLFYALLCSAEAVLFTKYAGNLTINSTTGTIVWTGLTGFAEVINNFYYYWGDMICSITGLIYEILVFLIMISLLKKYYAKGYMMLSIVQLFFPMARYIIVFAVRNNKAIDYNEYMRAKYDAYMRRAYQNGNPYGAPPYGNPYGNPYGTPPYGQNQGQAAPQDPFSEFDSGDKDPFGDLDDYGKKSEGQSVGEESVSEPESNNSEDGFFD